MAFEVGRGDQATTAANISFAAGDGTMMAGDEAKLEDWDPDTLMVAPSLVAQALTYSTLTIATVRLYGTEAVMQELSGLVERHP